jgi:hypothetical protein
VIPRKLILQQRRFRVQSDADGTWKDLPDTEFATKKSAARWIADYSDLCWGLRVHTVWVNVPRASYRLRRVA